MIFIKGLQPLQRRADAETALGQINVSPAQGTELADAQTGIQREQDAQPAEVGLCDEPGGQAALLLLREYPQRLSLLSGDQPSQIDCPGAAILSVAEDAFEHR